MTRLLAHVVGGLLLTYGVSQALPAWSVAWWVCMVIGNVGLFAALDNFFKE